MAGAGSHRTLKTMGEDFGLHSVYPGEPLEDFKCLYVGVSGDLIYILEGSFQLLHEE